MAGVIYRRNIRSLKHLRHTSIKNRKRDVILLSMQTTFHEPTSTLLFLSQKATEWPTNTVK